MHRLWIVVLLLVVTGCSKNEPPPGEPAIVERLKAKGLGWESRTFKEQVRRGDLENVKLYLDAGMPADICLHLKCRSALGLAARKGDLKAMRLLLDRGAAVDFRPKRGGTALLGAIAAEHIEAVRLLLDRGANPDGPKGAGWTPLAWAAQEGNAEIVQLLLERGADPARPTSGGETPLAIARRLDRKAVVKTLEPLSKQADAE